MRGIELVVITAIVSTIGISQVTPTRAQTTPQPWAQVGGLSCKVNPSVGFVIAGRQSLECVFTPSDRTPPQSYDGAINTVGLDIGVSAGGALGWAVFAPTTGVPAGALAGDYVGVSGDVGLGIGAGANILLGGSGRTFALQPVSVQGSVAVNAVLGLSSLTLRWH